MLWKILTLAAAGFAIYASLRRYAGLFGAAGQGGRGGRDVADLAPCPSCGAWREPGDDCACRLPPTP
ncbi:MAG: hypothetical protein ACK4WC_02440 [Rubrimonas sp.]